MWIDQHQVLEIQVFFPRWQNCIIFAHYMYITHRKLTVIANYYKYNRIWPLNIINELQISIVLSIRLSASWSEHANTHSSLFTNSAQIITFFHYMLIEESYGHIKGKSLVINLGYCKFQHILTNQNCQYETRGLYLTWSITCTNFNHFQMLLYQNQIFILKTLHRECMSHYSWY